MEEIIAAIDKQFGVGKTQGTVFFHHDEEGKLKTVSPMVQGCNSVSELTARLLLYSDALKTMATEMIQKTLPKN